MQHLLDNNERLSTSQPKFGTASWIFLGYSIAHAALLSFELVVNRPSHIGGIIVAAIAAALVYDNGLISLGCMLFPNARTDDGQQKLLALLSQPRFMAHAGLTPLLAVSATQLGQRGVEFLQASGALWSTLAVAAALALAGLVHHALHWKLTLKTPHPKAPPGAITSQLVRCTIAAVQEEKDDRRRCLGIVFMIFPAVLVCIWTFIVGVCMVMVGTDGKAVIAGRWLWATSLFELLSNAGPPWTMDLTGNFGEVVLVLGFVMAEAALR